MNKEVKELINNYAQSSKLYTNGEIKNKEAMAKSINELAEYNKKKFHFNTALIKLNRIKDGDTTYKFDEMEAKEIIDYINQLETNIDEAIGYIRYCQISDKDIFPVIEAEKMIEILKGGSNE